MVLELNDKNFEKSTKNQASPLVVDFWASWCMPCQMMAPVFHQLSREFEGRLRFGKLSTEDFPEIGQKYRVTSIPCLIIFHKGQEVERITGFMPAPMVKKWLEKVLNSR